MKKSILAVAVVATLFLASCSKGDGLGAIPNTSETITVIPASSVPATVLSSFAGRYSGATEVEWHKSSSLFEADFNHQNQRHSVGFDDNGTERSHNIRCTSAPVLEAVLNAFRARNPNDNVYEWKLTSNGDWKAHFNRNGVKWETTFSATGVFVKEEHY